MFVWHNTCLPLPGVFSGTVLRVERQDSAHGLIIRLEDRFTGDGAEHVAAMPVR
jgi:hypothetical protein